MTTLFEYFERVEIIHLPERTDRFRALSRELARSGYNIKDASIPHAPKPDGTFGFPSIGVYGNFLSHLDIITRAKGEGASTVLILEDDAIFSRRFKQRQLAIADQLSKTPWDILYIGHSLQGGTSTRVTPDLARFTGDLLWAHCYAINRSVMQRLTEYLDYTLKAPPGDPKGGKMYIDAALTLFRRQNPDVVCLVTDPCLSVQKGSQSNLGKGKSWIGRNLPQALSLGRSFRDECWRYGVIGISAKAKH
ncbi:hypothetical protein ABCW43_06930 [Neorhizobium sp. IRAMC:178]|uniref:hypothetical protein n=1 Tax=Neorhizobium tunisiense TaxID=3144793 RepID=UPI0031F62084